MKVTFFVVLTFISSSLLAKEQVKNFNKVLLEDVSKDLSNQNDEQFKFKKPINRGPASVKPMPEPESKINKNVNQTGLRSW